MLVKLEDLFWGWVRNPDGDGKNERITVRKAIDIMLPMKNFANHNSFVCSFRSWFGFVFWEGIWEGIEEDIMVLFLSAVGNEYNYRCINSQKESPKSSNSPCWMAIAIFQSRVSLVVDGGGWKSVHPTRKSWQLGLEDCAYYVVLGNWGDIVCSHGFLSIVYANDTFPQYTVAQVIVRLRLNRWQNICKHHHHQHWAVGRIPQAEIGV